MHRAMVKQRQRRRCRRLLERISSRETSYLPGLLIVLLVLLQNFELHMCRQLMRRSSSSSSDTDGITSHALLPKDISVEEPQDKRSLAAETTVGGQPEEIFSAPNDAADMSYDEYPMVVPKRAALLLDRLMVALHHALENEREGHRIGDFYANKNMLYSRTGDYKMAVEPLLATDEGTPIASNSHNFHMYSDDDPGVMLDYDFKDLNQINRATGETLMAKSFQRRAGGVGTALHSMDAATATPGGSTTTAGAGPGPGPGGRRIHHVANGGGRTYWRCYFNAISCF